VRITSHIRVGGHAEVSVGGRVEVRRALGRARVRRAPAGPLRTRQLEASRSHACLCVSCVARAPCVGRSLCVSGALCVGALCVGRSLEGPSPPVSDPSHVDIRSRDGSRSGARSHGMRAMPRETE